MIRTRTVTVLLLSLIILGTCTVIRPVEAQMLVSIAHDVTLIQGGSGSTTIMVGPTFGYTSWGIGCVGPDGLPPGVSCDGSTIYTTPTSGGTGTLQFYTSLSTPIGTYSMTVYPFVHHCSPPDPMNPISSCEGGLIVSLTSGSGTLCGGCPKFNLIVVPLVPEYPLGLPILGILMIIGYGLVRRRTRNA